MIFEGWLWNLRCCGDCLAALWSMFLRIWLCFSACSFLQGLMMRLCGCGRLPRSGSWRCLQVTLGGLLQLRLTGAESTWRQVGREARRAAALLTFCWRDIFCVALFELNCCCGLDSCCLPAFHVVLFPSYAAFVLFLRVVSCVSSSRTWCVVGFIIFIVIIVVALQKRSCDRVFHAHCDAYNDSDMYPNIIDNHDQLMIMTVILSWITLVASVAQLSFLIPMIIIMRIIYQ
jgi:hypothetical protein